MARAAVSRKFMLGVGLLAVLVILLTQAFQRETTHLLDQATAKKAAQSGQEKRVLVTAPSDAVTSDQAVPSGSGEAIVIAELSGSEKEKPAQPVIDKTVAADFLKTLLRVCISPQAP